MAQKKSLLGDILWIPEGRLHEKSERKERSKKEPWMDYYSNANTFREELIKRDPLAWGVFVERYSSLIWKVAWKFESNDEQKSNDLFADIYLHISERIEKWRPTGKLSGWLYIVAVNFCRDRYRWQQRQPEVQSLKAEDEEGHTLEDRTPTSVPDPHDVLEKKEFYEAVWDCLERMIANYRQALYLEYWEGLSVEESADQMGATVSQVNNWRARGKIWLKQCLSQFDLQ